jgi:hypothetical protein
MIIHLFIIKNQSIMKKIMLLLVGLSLLSCSNNDGQENGVEDLASASHRNCPSEELLKEQLKNDPEWAANLAEIERQTEEFQLSKFKLVNGKIVIPVVVNVLYRTDAENITDAQIQSQIDVLNKDFNALNSDFSNVPAAFNSLKANIGISFELASIKRKYVNRSTWGTSNLMKTSTGLTPTSPTTHLNFWVCTIGGGILGYAQFPGGAASTDGVVVDSKYVGTTGTATAPFNLGRTATHEVGHWLNLRHIWGDATCGSDLVADTPTHNTSNYGNPAYPHYSTCSGTPIEMTMNYMDYVNDNAMYMFTTGQKARMLALFNAGSSRYSFAQ